MSPMGTSGLTLAKSSTPSPAVAAASSVFFWLVAVTPGSMGSTSGVVLAGIMTIGISAVGSASAASLAARAAFTSWNFR